MSEDQEENKFQGYIPSDVFDTISMTKEKNLENKVSRYLDSIDERPDPMESSLRFYPGTERDNYDYNTERFGVHKTTFTESIAHIIKGSTGVGVLTMHEAFMNGGIWTAVGTTIFIGFLNTYTMYMLAKSAQLMYIRLRVAKLSYPDLAEVAAATGAWKGFRKVSKQFRYIVDICIVLYMCGTCCIYQIMIANTFKLVFEDINVEIKDLLSGNIRLYILISSPVLLFLCAIRSLKFLAPFSMIADVFVALCVLATVYYSMQTNQKLSDRPVWKDFHSFLKYYGICMYSTCGIAMCLPIENNMRHPKQFTRVLKWGMGIVVILMGLIGFFGYWGWGETCKSPVNVHMPRSIYTDILQFLLATMLCVTFAVEFWVAFRIVWHYICKKCYKRHGRAPRKHAPLVERLLRLFFTTIVTSVAVLVPNLIHMMAFMGLFILGLINFIFPAMIEILITWKQYEYKIRWWCRIVKNIILILFGFLMSGSSFIQLSENYS